MGDGWDYGPGNVNDAGSWFGVQYPDYVNSGSVNFGSGWSGFLQDIGKIGASTWAQKTLMQQNQEGARYMEGQRYAVLNQGIGLNMGTLLMLGGIVALALLLKD